MRTKPLTVKDYMSASLVTFTPDRDVFEAIRALVEHRISAAPVIDLHGNLVGVFSEQDSMKVGLRAAYHDEWGGSVSEFMNHEVKSVDVDTSLVELGEIFLQATYRLYPVVKDNRVVGQISRHDVLKALLGVYAEREAR